MAMVFGAGPIGTVTALAALDAVAPAGCVVRVGMAADQGAAATSILPMGSLHEAMIFLFFEDLVLDLRDRLAVSPEAMRANHTNLEWTTKDWQRRFSLEGRTALITGALSGIGFAIGEVFADTGAAVIGQGRSEERLAKLGAAVKVRGQGFTAVSGDLATNEGAADIAARARDAHPQIDILVNPAGIARTGPAVDFDLAGWNETLNVNLTAPFILSKALRPGMMARRLGKIIDISSQTGVIALEDHAAYAASKGGLNALTRSLMTEAAPHNFQVTVQVAVQVKVQVNAICPTVVLTEMGEKLWSAPEKKDPFIDRTPLGRFGEPVEIADMALYLASPASDLVNGAIMMIEGGYSSI